MPICIPFLPCSLRAENIRPLPSRNANDGRGAARCDRRRETNGKVQQMRGHHCGIPSSYLFYVLLLLFSIDHTAIGRNATGGDTQFDLFAALGKEDGRSLAFLIGLHGRIPIQGTAHVFL